MIIHSRSTKGSKLPKLLSVFPFMMTIPFLVHKYSATDTGHGTNIMENFILQNQLKTIEEAKDIALNCSKHIGVDVFLEKQVERSNPDLLRV